MVASTGHEPCELGPIDYLVIELPQGTTTLTEQMTDQIIRSVSDRTLRILELLIVERDGAGDLTVTEFEELTDRGLRGLDASLVEILAGEDVHNLASAIAPGRCAVVIVWEYLTATSFTAAVRASGATLVAQGRIPAQAIAATLRGDDEDA
ncbi:DUF1269 domain-containing protein [Gordonia sp. HNM0687]|uniref:DUF1269 domain-containing protein n=1 Tax=Gordonia mangrovi TaxID=2665643 RepID=A0A6L7GWE3_9ACTN|nr:DUF6325 family protein [Gordonia mangrovi]MXP23787.1 DUF1269 domain-containing protein [Gordonia mangrovi]UVF79837.1 DUF6325 family protein [Gordonia mangrovi]